MDTAQFAILAGLSVVSIGLCVYLLSKIRTITYLLEQPVVKKMSPQLKLKPVKVDELDENRANNPSRNNANGAPQNRDNRGPRPGFDGERQNRDNRDNNRDRAPRADRPEGEGRREGGERGERFDRGPRNDRGDRGDRGERGERFGGREGGRDRDRGGRDRHERGDRGDRFGGRERRDFNSDREAAPAAAPVAAEGSAPAAPAPAALAPRRPLPSTVDQDNGPKDASVDALAANPQSAEDALFTRDDSDIQHGRRHQPKKKPRFDVADEEVKEETKAL